MPTGPVDLKYREFLTNIDENDGLKLQGDARNWIGNRIGDALRAPQYNGLSQVLMI
jgi:hypothetical protein